MGGYNVFNNVRAPFKAVNLFMAIRCSPVYGYVTFNIQEKRAYVELHVKNIVFETSRALKRKFNPEEVSNSRVQSRV